MPPLWPRKSIKSNGDSRASPNSASPHHHLHHPHHPHHSPKPKCYEDSSRRMSLHTPRVMSGLGSRERRNAHPLPRPTAAPEHRSSVPVSHGSSKLNSPRVSSSDHKPINARHPAVGGRSGRLDSRNGSKPRSPCISARGPVSPTSPLQSITLGSNMNSPARQQQSHPLPLPPPPVSPASPSLNLPAARDAGEAESNIESPNRLYKKGKLIGRGTFGHVYLGFRCGYMCAIKEVLFFPDDRSSMESMRQLTQEINLLSQFSHANIVNYIGCEMVEEALLVYLEYMAGGSIYKLLKDYGAFEEGVIRSYTKQIVSGLAYLHERNVIHRDIKGANILVHPDGEVKLSDFGMAKLITSYSAKLSFKGSPFWMAPEVVLNKGYGLPADIWSLGCTVIEMATARPPWDQPEGVQIEYVAALFKIGNTNDVPSFPEHLSVEAKNFIGLCVQRDPLARPTASDLLEHPFIKDQITNFRPKNFARVPFLPNFAGSRAPLPPAPELNSYRSSPAREMDYIAKPVRKTPKPVKTPRENEYPRMRTSVPPSLGASPWREPPMPYLRSCLHSPLHPLYSPRHPTGFPKKNDYIASPLRPKTRTSYNISDQVPEAAVLKSLTPHRSSTTRFN